MAMGFRTTVTLLVGLLVFAVGGILLQIFLSKRESGWPGLVLPGITFLLSLISVFSVAAFGGAAEVMGTILLVVLLYNLPTLVLLAIYFACRGGRKKKGELEKMNIDDL